MSRGHKSQGLPSRVLATLAYLALLVLLRISGKRALSKRNAFDLVSTISLGFHTGDDFAVEGRCLHRGNYGIRFVEHPEVRSCMAVRASRVGAATGGGEPQYLYRAGHFLDTKSDAAI